ncbi:amino acid transporter [Aspergillus arachidicola]|uniref:Amino acid transporter n=1 Tax=Aspergillus arachidicola TaxID=656916 RepID=A0A2G7EMI6_9EURO|nr:amino acid transporter [Aspergillus arachidicola]
MDPSTIQTKEKPIEDPNALYLEKGEIVDDVTYDPVFGEITDEGPNYRNVGFFGTVVLMMKTQIGLGVLSIPTAFDTLGMVPGVIVLIAISCITTWSDYMVGSFKLRHREVYGIDDAGALMFGTPGRVVLAVAFCLYWIFVAGSGILGISIGLNAVSTHGACTAIFVAVAAILGFACSSIRTLGKITWLAWIGLPCILIAILVVTIAVGVQDRPPTAPQTDGPWVSDFKIIGNPTFAQAITAVSSLVFAFSGTPGFFSIVSEMRDPRKFTPALLICQAGVTAVYITIGCVIAYGLSLPGLIVTTTIVTHIPAKYIFVHLLRGSKHLISNTVTHWTVWLACTLSVTVIAYIIASAIPVFDGLVSLIGALLGTMMCFQPMGCMWLYDNWHKRREGLASKQWWFMAFFSVFVVVSGTFLTVAGTYGSVVGIMDSYKTEGGSAAFTCADNSGSV